MSAYQEIENLLCKYFDGLYESDPKILETVFHSKAIYATADEGDLLHRTMGEYFLVVAERVAPASNGEARQDVIHSIELAGKKTAFARVGCSIGKRNFTDFLSLIHIDGRWQIMSKIFQISESNNKIGES